MKELRDELCLINYVYRDKLSFCLEALTVKMSIFQYFISESDIYFIRIPVDTSFEEMAQSQISNSIFSQKSNLEKVANKTSKYSCIYQSCS